MVIVIVNLVLQKRKGWMMSNKNDGGPDSLYPSKVSRPDNSVQAFPSLVATVKGGLTSEHSEYGMTLRDYFAGQALPTINPDSFPTMCKPQHIAFYAYEIADAMIKQREVK